MERNVCPQNCEKYQKTGICGHLFDPSRTSPPVDEVTTVNQPTQGIMAAHGYSGEVQDADPVRRTPDLAPAGVRARLEGVRENRPHPETNLREGFYLLESRGEVLHKALAGLEERLAPVLKTAKTDSAGIPREWVGPPEGSSQAVHKAYDLTAMIESAIARVHEICDNLDL